MALVLVTPPAEEPISLDEAKSDMRVDADFTEHDALIEGYIAAGRQHAETICRRAFVTQSWRITADRFPSPMSGPLDRVLAWSELGPGRNGRGLAVSDGR